MKKSLLFFFSLFIPYVLNAEILPKDVKLEYYSDFSGGLNTIDPAHKLPNNESPYLRNVTIDHGEIQSVNGYSILGSSSSLQDVELFLTFVKSNGGKEYILSDSSVVIKTQDFITSQPIKNGLNKIFRLRAKQIENKVWFTNGSDSVFTYDGTTVTVLDGKTYSSVKTPSVPKFKYLEYYQNHVFGFNTPGDQSLLQWSALFSTDTVPQLQAPDSENAWINPTFSISVDKGNGAVGTFLRVYHALLYMGKEDQSISFLYGDEDTNYQDVKIVNNNGFLSDESIVDHENMLIGYCRDGICSFDGKDMIYLSDKIFPSIKEIINNTQKTVYFNWETQNDFNIKGQVTGATTTVDGLLVYRATVPVNFNRSETFGVPLSSFTPLDTALHPNTAFVILSTVIFSEIVSSFTYKPYSARVNLTGVPGAGAIPVITFKNLGNSQMCSSTASSNDSTYWNFTTWNCEGQFIAAGNEIKSGSVAVMTQILPNPANYTASIASVNELGHCDCVFVTTSPQQFISEISTTTSLSGWSNFDSVYNLNGGNISFFYRSATSPVNIATYPFIPISAGSVIKSSQTDTFIQWASTISGTVSNTPNLDIVNISYVQGGAGNVNPIGASWNRRYWLAVTTTTDGNTSLIYVKSRNTSKNPNAWTVLEGINIKSMLRDGNFFYAGASTTGAFYRLDYGTNYGGNAINSFYETNENTLGNNFFDKQLVSYFLDIDKNSGASVTLGTKINNGAYSNYSQSIDGSGRLLKYLGYPNDWGNSFRWRFTENQLDKEIKMNGFGVGYIAAFKQTDNQ